jgi:hypothetical protein
MATCARFVHFMVMTNQQLKPGITLGIDKYQYIMYYMLSLSKELQT